MAIIGTYNFSDDSQRNSFINDVIEQSEEFEETIDDKNKEISDAEDDNNELQDENDELTEKVIELEKELEKLKICVNATYATNQLMSALAHKKRCYKMSNPLDNAKVVSQILTIKFVPSFEKQIFYAKNICLWHDGTLRPAKGHNAKCKWVFDGQIWRHL